jgi:hypothetical protein
MHVDIVQSDPGPGDNLQVGRRLEKLARNLRTIADDQGGRSVYRLGKLLRMAPQVRGFHHRMRRGELVNGRSDDVFGDDYWRHWCWLTQIGNPEYFRLSLSTWRPAIFSSSEGASVAAAS